MATRRLRPEDWAPVPQTRIQIRAQHSPREPRDKHVHIAQCAQKPPRPSPINYPPGESPPIPAGRESLDTDSPRAPEIVDFAAPSTTTWPRRGLPAHIVYQQQQWGPRRIGSPGSVSQYSSSRQSEMSFGILDYYTRDPSPVRSETLPPTPKLPQGVLSERGCPKIGTPVIHPAMEKFDFGLGFEGERERSERSNGDGKGNDAFESATTAPDARPGAAQTQQQQEAQAVIRTPPPPPPPPKTDPTTACKPTYSLFPKDTTPPSRPSITLTNRKDSTSTIPSDTAIPPHTQPDPSYRPRKESLTSSLRSRKDSCTSYHRTGSAQRIPLRVFSASSSASNSSVYTTPRTSNAVPLGATNIRTSSFTATASPPDSARTGGKPQSRWSEDTITSPSPTALAFSTHLDHTPPSHGRRVSFGSLLRGVESDGRLSASGGQYPACFFEDDDDEVVPLRRKLHFGRGGQGSGEWEGERKVKGGGGWRRWVLCGCAG